MEAKNERTNATQRNATQRNANKQHLNLKTESRILITALIFFTTGIVSPNTFAQLCRYGIYSQDETNIRDRVNVTPGLIGSATKVEIGVEANINGYVTSSGDIFLRDRCTVKKSVFAAGTVTAQNEITVTGKIESNVNIETETIPVKTVITGTQDYNLYNGNSLELQPGNYGNMHIYDGAVLNMSAGTYNFASFIVEAGSAILNFDPQAEFIEINVQNDLRFGDRNQFILNENADPVQIQFYTNSSNQVKVGTDSTFNGVITAPMAQIYIFPKCTVNGNLYGKSVWIDTDSTLNIYLNCTEFNTTFDDTLTENMCSEINFETEGWIPVNGGESSEIKLNDIDKSYGNYSLEVVLNTDEELSLEGSTPISMLFSEDAQWLTAQIDVLSNAAPYNIWGANIELYLMAENDESYTYAGTLAYDPEDPYTEEFSTLETFVPDNIAEKMIKGTPVYAMIKISEQKEYGVFWIDNIQFCDDQGLCNFYCNNISSTEEDTFKEKPLPLPQETVLKTSWLYDDNEIMNNQNELGGKITNKETIEITFDAELVISSPLGENIKIYVGSYSLMPEESSTFSIPSNSLPFFNYNFILKAQLKLTEHRVIQENETQDAIYMSSEKFFKFNNDDTINIFNWSYLFENYDGVLFDAASSPPSSLLPTEEMVTDDGTITVTTLLVQLQDVDIDLDNWDTEISTDMDTESGSDNDTDSTIIQID